MARIDIDTQATSCAGHIVTTDQACTPRASAATCNSGDTLHRKCQNSDQCILQNAREMFAIAKTSSSHQGPDTPARL